MNEAVLQSSHKDHNDDDVLRLADVDAKSISALLSNYGLSLETVATGGDIPGSYWGDEEAGLIGHKLLVRTDTPIHSILHEACHYVCMDTSRRNGLDTDAGGDYDEENAVCYLQILLADHIESFDRQRMFQDMDRWGYTFRLGSARKWFENDAQDARDYLLEKGILNQHNQATFNLRDA